MRVRDFRTGETNRTESDELQWGGKGINVSTILRNLGVENAALGFLAGFTGRALDQGLRDAGIRTDFIWLEEGLTRVNVKIKADQETEINGFGVHVTVGKDRGKMGFEDLLRVRETRKAFYLFLSENQAWILPKAQMEDREGDCARLRELFSA